MPVSENGFGHVGRKKRLCVICRRPPWGETHNQITIVDRSDYEPENGWPERVEAPHFETKDSVCVAVCDHCVGNIAWAAPKEDIVTRVLEEFIDGRGLGQTPERMAFEAWMRFWKGDDDLETGLRALGSHPKCERCDGEDSEC